MNDSHRLLYGSYADLYVAKSATNIWNIAIKSSFTMIIYSCIYLFIHLYQWTHQGGLMVAFFIVNIKQPYPQTGVDPFIQL